MKKNALYLLIMGSFFSCSPAAKAPGGSPLTGALSAPIIPLEGPAGKVMLSLVPPIDAETGTVVSPLAAALTFLRAIHSALGMDDFTAQGYRTVTASYSVASPAGEGICPDITIIDNGKFTDVYLHYLSIGSPILALKLCPSKEKDSSIYSAEAARIARELEEKGLDPRLLAAALVALGAKA